MLSELEIRDFAIISHLILELGPGFNVMTGETGAGKSIIIDAVGLLIGGRADRHSIRAGASRALIEGRFVLDERTRPLINPILEREGLESDIPDELILAREVRVDGRSIARVNGRTVTLAILRELGSLLIDIHGQSQHLSLLRPREHINLLDRYAGLESRRGEIAHLVRELNTIRAELAALMRDEAELARRIDMLNYQIAEIEAANPRPGEDNELEKERYRLANAEQLISLADQAYRLLYEGEDEAPSAADLLGQVAAILGKLSQMDSDLEPRHAQAEEMNFQAEDLAAALRAYRDGIEFDPMRQREIEERLELLNSLKRKYGPTLQDVLAYSANARAELEQITHSEERIEELRAQEDDLLHQIGEIAAGLSDARHAAAESLSAAVETELADLRMEGARFGVKIEQRDDPEGVYIGEKRLAFDSTGVDRVEFLISANPGEPLRPLVKVASGGETARLMLALKTVLSRADPTPTLIFDEIDQGIGGRVGAVVGKKLWRLAENHQVLVVTHLAQLAGFGDVHYKVSKHISADRTVTRVERLDEKGRVAELAEMLGAQGDGVRQSAHDILMLARRVKSGEGE